MRKALGKKAPAVIELIKRWPEIAGAQTARFATCAAVRFPSSGARTDGTLELHVLPAAALFVEQDQQRILAKVNAFLGPKTVARLRIKQREPAEALGGVHQTPVHNEAALRNCEELTELLTQLRSHVHKKNTS